MKTRTERWSNTTMVRSVAERKNFFFQAEDGIRDLYVTGVQTCALPIYSDLRKSLPVQVKGTDVDFAALFVQCGDGNFRIMAEDDDPAVGDDVAQRSEERRVGKEGSSSE